MPQGTILGPSRSGTEYSRTRRAATDFPVRDSPEAVLERLKASIEDALHRLINGGCIATHYRECVEDFRRRVASVCGLLEDDGTPIGETPTDVQCDFDLLA